MRTLRDLLAVVLVLVATALAAVWLPGVWLQRHLVEQSGFLAIAQPLSSDAATQQTLVDSAVDEILANDAIPGRIATMIGPFAKEQGAKLTELPAYAQIWDETMVQVHEDLFAPGASDLTVDLSPAVDALVDPIQERLPFGLEIPVPENPTVTLAQIPDIPVLQQAQEVLPHARWTGPAALALALLAVLIAGRRRFALLLAGIGTAAAGASTWVLTSQVEQIVPDTLDQADFIAPLFQAFERQFAADLSAPSFILLGAGAAVIVLAALAMLVPTSRER
ncbi:hypothetical protein Bequi_05730 [Brachybacterium sp. JHP9]|uniref:Uncharacterized protein n=1 Tax=Brachybacterium equifaecis TaxID=2910770 RepID=A0ABT0R1T4_9MICO|nr:hypothetical protein [Brachybacterium equifaecis]MCL6422890.1 hypothetical protein [Brachybacterium equifaecis]